MTITRNHEPVTPTSNAPAPRRSPWLWVGGIALAVVCLFSAFIIGRGGSSDTPAPVAAGPQTVTVAAPADGGAPSDIAVPGQPDGCLGGPDPYTAVLPAQQAATLDAAGAAGFARAAARYLLIQLPGPADLEDVIPQLFVNPDPFLNAPKQQSANPPPSGTTTRWTRVSESSYMVTALGDRADVTVAVHLELLYPDGTATTIRLTQRFILQAADGHWKIAEAPPTDPMPDAGTGGVRYFPGGC